MGRIVDGALAAAWERRLAKQQRSRLSVSVFCQREGVSTPSFYAWRKRLRKTSPDRLFARVELPAQDSPAAGIRIEFPSGAILTLRVDAPIELVRTAIRAAMSSASNEERPSC